MLDIYINGKKADVDESVSVALTYQATDLECPTATKTAYSKTITLKGTPNNNSIFAEQWKLDRTISDDFDASKRVDCQIFRNGDLIENGYICLNSIGIEKGLISYNITYYSKLGDFFYNLMYDDDSTDKRTLADLYYGFVNDNTLIAWTPEEEKNNVLLNYNMYYIKDAWDGLETYLHGISGGSMVGEPRPYEYKDAMDIRAHIVPVPTYSGYYEDFDNDKILVATDYIKVKDAETTEKYFPQTIVESGVTYKPKDGFFLVTAPRDLDEWEVRSFNSAQQRPSIKLSTVLKAVSDPVNNGGYSVIWDDDITDEYSKIGQYYNNSFILLDKIDFSTTVNDGTKKLYLNSTSELTSKPKSVYLKDDSGSTIIDCTQYKYPKVSVTLQHQIEMEKSGLPSTPPTKIYSSFWSNQKYWNATFNCYQLVSEYTDESGITHTSSVSPIYALYSETAQSEKDNFPFIYQGCMEYAKKLIAQKFYMDEENIIFKETEITQTDMTSDTILYTDNPFTMSVKLPIVNNAKIYVQSATISVMCHIGRDYYNAVSAGESNNEYAYYVNSKNIQQYNNPITTQFMTPDDDYTNAIYDGSVSPVLQSTACQKKTILGGTDTPYSYLIGFARLFGLKFLVDRRDKKVEILTRENYYRNSSGSYDLVDYNDYINWDKKVEIDNSVAEVKWLNYGLETPDSYAQYLYDMKYNGEYGNKYFNTNYNFNSDVKNIFDGTVYKNIVPYRLWSQYFANPYNVTPLIMSKTYTLTEWNNSGETIDKTMFGWTSTHNTIKEMDDLPKICCFDKENKNVGDIKSCLVFFNRMYYLPEYYSSEYKQGNDFIIYDNRQEMMDLNGNPCHLRCGKGRPKRDGETDEEYASATDVYITEHTRYIPRFGKYLTDLSNKVISSYDFVKPADAVLDRYIGDDAVYDENSTLLEQFWFPYSADVYDKNSKKVTLYVTKLEHPSSAMRKFYLFENSIWVINKITDYNADGEGDIKVEFLKVNDPSTYINYN